MTPSSGVTTEDLARHAVKLAFDVLRLLRRPIDAKFADVDGWIDCSSRQENESRCLREKSAGGSAWFSAHDTG